MSPAAELNVVTHPWLYIQEAGKIALHNMRMSLSEVQQRDPSLHISAAMTTHLHSLSLPECHALYTFSNEQCMWAHDNAFKAPWRLHWGYSNGRRYSMSYTSRSYDYHTVNVKCKYVKKKSSNRQKEIGTAVNMDGRSQLQVHCSS